MDEAEIFEGAENRLTMNQTCTFDFRCKGTHQEKNFVELSVDNKGSEEILMTAKCTNEPVTVSVKESQLEKVDRILESLKTASPEEESNLLAELGVVTTFTKPKKVHYSEDSDCGLYSDGSDDLDEPDTTSNL